MTVRIATFNVENLFERAKVLDTTTWAEGEPVLAAYGAFSRTSAAAEYSDDDRRAMLAALETLAVLVRTGDGRLVRNPDPFDAWALLRENRGDFLRQPRHGDAEIVAAGRGDWLGWVDLLSGPVDETATRMTARVVAEVAADVLCVVEADNRASLVRFNDELLERRYRHTMLIDGNDRRGIDIGLYTTARIPIRSVRSHVDDPDPGAPGGRLLFSRDCPVYQVRLPGGQDLFLVLNHLKSQSFSSGDPDPLRSRQSRRVREIYDELRAEGAGFVAVLGDLNKGPTGDTPPRYPTLEPLLGPDSPLVDTAALAGFDPGPRPGTFQSCGRRDRLDYILVSPGLAGHVTAGGVCRSGLWGNPANVGPPKDWAVYPEVTGPRHAASDHAAVWVDLDL